MVIIDVNASHNTHLLKGRLLSAATGHLNTLNDPFVVNDLQSRVKTQIISLLIQLDDSIQFSF